MTTEVEAFDQFDEHLKLDPDERERARECHNQIRDILNAEEYTTGAFLQGSFRRKTMIAPLRDIDMVLLLHPNLRAYLGDQIREGFHLGTRGGPTRVMELIRDALQPHYPHATFEIGKHALTIDFGDGEFHFDVVPAFDSEDGPDADIFIANTQTGGWERSNTRELIRVVADRNQACKKRFVHQVRMVKHGVKHSTIGDFFFGLLSESATYHAITDSRPHPEACLAVFTEAVRLLEARKIPDPTGVDNLCDNLDDLQTARAAEQFRRWRDQAVEARRLADAGDHPAAVDVWHGIFGDPFPEATPQSELEAARAWQGGAPTVTGRVSRTPAAGPVAVPTRSWRSR